MSIELKKEYADALNALGLNRDRDPFPVDPPKCVDYWADNKKILDQIIRAQLDSAMFSSSFIYLLYGPFGGGKTFAINYISNIEIQKKIFKAIDKSQLESCSIKASAIVPLKSGQLTFALHKCIVERCFSIINEDPELVKIFMKTKDLSDGYVRVAFENIISTINIPIGGKLEITGLETSDGYKFLTQNRSSIGKLSDVNELVDSIRVLIQVLSKKYFRVIIAIDELENLLRATATERFLVSDFFRKLHGAVERDLTIFLIFTLDSYDDVPRLLQKALLSRVKSLIEFPFIRDPLDVEEYITDCITKRTGVPAAEVIDADVVKEIASSLLQQFKGNLSFRAINAEMHRIFSDVYFASGEQGKIKINRDLYLKARKNIVSDESVKKIVDSLRGAVE